jgi:hypothetical protein
MGDLDDVALLLLPMSTVVRVILSDEDEEEGEESEDRERSSSSPLSP